MPRDSHVLCVHCQKYMSRTRERAHRAKHQAPLYSPPPRIPSKLRRVFDVQPDRQASESNQLDENIPDGMEATRGLFIYLI